MNISPQTQAILLLTVALSGKSEGTTQPLTPTEWQRFAAWLGTKSLQPQDLLQGRLSDVLSDWQDKKVTLERLEALLARGPALALSVEKWLRAGLWILTRADAEYPRRLKQRLGGVSPAVLFGVGPHRLLDCPGLAVVGSRKASAQDLDYSRALGVLAGQNGYSIVSGGARGVDEAAMLGTLASEGTAVGVLATDLFRASSSAIYREYVTKGDLALVTSFNPEAGFSIGNLMQRNKYIYCLSDAAVVVHSGPKGGTWTGATENLKKRWVPLWVKETNDPAAANEGLHKLGAAWLPTAVEDIEFDRLFDGDAYTASAVDQPMQKSLLETQPRQPTVSHADANAPEDKASRPDLQDVTFYELFLVHARQSCIEVPRSPDELADELQLHKMQVKSWLQRAVTDGHMTKLNRPVRYQWNPQDKLPLS